MHTQTANQTLTRLSQNIITEIKEKTSIFTIPDVITKQLSFGRYSGDKRKMVVSTNWLTLMDFPKDAPVTERSLGKNKGIVVERIYDLFDENGNSIKTKKVYERKYKSSKTNKLFNNVLETQLDIRSQKLINDSFISYDSIIPAHR